MTDGMREAYGASKVTPTAEENQKKIDPGNEFSGPSNKKLEDLIAWIRRQPDANLRTGEGKLLVDEIDRLNAEVNRLNGYFESHRDNTNQEIGR